ncbi:MAG: hypothetical protein ACTSXV_02310 [Alphaproteobacteria bacterium]
MKKQFWFLTGASGSGKGHFRKHFLPSTLFYSLRSMTTRAIRDGEREGDEYFFTNVDKIHKTKKATYLEINPTWLYAVSELEIFNHQNQNLIYDVIQPEYIRQMIDWCQKNNLEYDFKIIYFMTEKTEGEQRSLMTERNKKETRKEINIRLKRDTSFKSYKKYKVEPDYSVNNFDYTTFSDQLLLELKKFSNKTQTLCKILEERKLI